MYFLARRLYLSYLVIFGTEVFIYQMAQIMLSTGIGAILPYMIYAISEQRDRRTNALNELLTLFSCYAFTTFNIISVDDNFQVGYLVISVLGAYMVIVILSTFWSSIKSLCAKLRIRLIKRRY